MKYEITKGSEKDFEGVPVWALYVETYRGNVFASEGYSAGDRYIALTGLDKGKEFIVDDETNPPGRIIAERRPITEPSINKSSWRETAQVGTQSVESAMKNNAQWDGEGLPPVGVECEFYDCEDWHVVKVKFIGDKYAVLQDLKFDVERVYCVADKPDKFRPIRSPEDVARDEAVYDLEHHDSSCESIYDAIAAGKIRGVKLE